MIRGLRYFCERSMMKGCIEVYVTTEPRDGRRSVALPMKFEDVEDGLHSEPTLQMDMTGAQQLMDELWHCGLRPTEGSGSAGALAATERHLADMQRLTFTLLDGDAQLGHIARGQVNSATTGPTR